MIVYACRHASAGQRRGDVRQDALRALDARGQEQARQMGAALAALGVQVDVVLTSPLKRATQTAALLAGELGYQGAWQREAGLRPEADYAAFGAMLERYDGYEAVLVVGHKPSLPACLSRLLGAPRIAIELKKGSVARVELAAHRTRLEWLMTPAVAAALYSRPTTRSKPKTARK